MECASVAKMQPIRKSHLITMNFFKLLKPIMKEGLNNAIDVRKLLTSSAMIVVWSTVLNAIYRCTMEEGLLNTIGK